MRRNRTVRERGREGERERGRGSKGEKGSGKRKGKPKKGPLSFSSVVSDSLSEPHRQDGIGNSAGEENSAWRRQLSYWPARAAPMTASTPHWTSLVAQAKTRRSGLDPAELQFRSNTHAHTNTHFLRGQPSHQEQGAFEPNRSFFPSFFTRTH